MYSVLGSSLLQNLGSIPGEAETLPVIHCVPGLLPRKYNSPGSETDCWFKNVWRYTSISAYIFVVYFLNNTETILSLPLTIIGKCG